MKTFSISASKIARLCGKNYHEGEEMYLMVDVIWQQLDPQSFYRCFPAPEEDKRRTPSPPKVPIPEEIKRMCANAHRELESVTEERYLKTLIEKRDAMTKKVKDILQNGTADEKTAISSFVRTNMNGTYGRKSEDKILDIFEALTLTKANRRIYETSRDFTFDLNGETIRMVAYGTPDGLLNQGTGTFRILECKAKMGDAKPSNRMIKDYLQAITYQMIYGGDNGPSNTVLLTHFESAKAEGKAKSLRVENRVLSEWSLNHLIDREWSEQNKMDEIMPNFPLSETVEMQSENQAGVLRVLHISPDDAQRVWNKMMERVRLLLMIVTAIINSRENQEIWISTTDKAMFLENAMQALQLENAMQTIRSIYV